MNHSSKVHKIEHANESLISVNGVRATIDNISTSDVGTQLQPEQNAQRLKKKKNPQSLVKSHPRLFSMPLAFQFTRRISLSR